MMGKLPQYNKARDFPLPPTWNLHTEVFNWRSLTYISVFYRFFRELSAFYQLGDNMYVIITKLFFLVRLEREAMMFWEFRGNEHLAGTFFHSHQYVHDSRVRINNLPNLLHTCMRANHSHKILYFLKLVFYYNPMRPMVFWTDTFRVYERNPVHEQPTNTHNHAIIHSSGYVLW